MDLNEYQTEALRTANMRDLPDVRRPEILRMVFALGVAGEAGEVADLVKKEIGHQHGSDPDKMLKELGDVLWYVAALASQYGFTLEHVAGANIVKLRARYKDGFSVAESKNRASEAPPNTCAECWMHGHSTCQGHAAI